jgi:hypothetical protein
MMKLQNTEIDVVLGARNVAVLCKIVEEVGQTTARVCLAFSKFTVGVRCVMRGNHTRRIFKSSQMAVVAKYIHWAVPDMRPPF